MDIHAAIEEYLGSKQNSITHSTYDWYACFLDYFYAFCKEHHLTDLSQITAVHVQKFVSAAKTTNTNTRHHRAQIVKGFLNWCAQDDEMGIRDKTVQRIEMPKTVQPDLEIFTDKEFDRLLKACSQTNHPHRNRAILYLLLDTGIRASELCYDGERPEEETGLRMENLILGRGDSFIRVMGKSRKPRSIGCGHETSLAVRRYLNRERRRTDSPYVFLDRDGEPLSVRMLEQLLDKLGELAGVPNTHPHRFRHAFGINQLLNGTSSLVLMQLMAIIALIMAGYSADWTGFNAKKFQSGKTLWDWLQLLIIPAVLAVGGYMFNLTVSRNDRNAAANRDKTEHGIAADNQQEAALQASIDKLSELLLDKKLRESQPEHEVQKIARVRTLTVLPRLNGVRKGNVIRFLHESDLINKGKSIIVLRGTNLSYANLRGTDLSEADLWIADLRKVDLREAELWIADLSHADLRGAYLSGTNLSHANLYNVTVEQEQLDKAKSLKGATMPDGSIHP